MLMVLADSPNMLHPAGSEAHRLASVSWLLFGLAAGVAVLVLSLLAVGLFRRGDAADADDASVGSPDRDHRFIIGGGLILPFVVLTLVAVVTVTTTAALRHHDDRALVVDVQGQDWFWGIHYQESGVNSANLIRLPVDVPVDLVLRSSDVDHSFWVPRLAGKVDLIPGQTNHLRFTPNQVGQFRGECAEFCGLQHANMAFVVQVMPRADFERWLADRGRSSGTLSSAARAGQKVFAASSCAGCHTIKGVSDGEVGPDLSDFGSRPAIGAGVLTNTPTHLASWIRDAPASKPGAKMPPIALTDKQVADLVAYLESLP
jgi:cytochrome c oxidase subunit 2